MSAIHTAAPLIHQELGRSGLKAHLSAQLVDPLAVVSHLRAFENKRK